MVMVPVAATPDRSPTYGNWRKPMSAGIGRLGTLGTLALLVATIVVMITMMLAGMLPALAVAAVVGALVATVVVADRHDRTLAQRMATRVGWWRARNAGAHLYRSGPLGHTPWGVCQLPGIAARSRLSEWRDAYNRPFALIWLPTSGHYTVVLAAEPDGASLVDSDQVDRWVEQWGRWLAGLGTEPGVVAASVTIETAPDSGARLHREVSTNTDPEAPAVARAMLAEVMADYPSGSATIGASVAITFTGTRNGKRRQPAEMARDLASRLPGLTTGLQATGAGHARPMPAQQLCETIRTAYDPAAARLIDTAHTTGTTPTISWDDVGPAAAEARWDSYRHDSGVSVSWMMSEAPRGEVYSSILHQLLSPHPDIARKRVTLLYRPLDPARAARVVETDRNNADFRATTTDRPAARGDLRPTGRSDDRPRGGPRRRFGQLWDGHHRHRHHRRGSRQRCGSGRQPGRCRTDTDQAGVRLPRLSLRRSPPSRPGPPGPLEDS